MSLEESSARIRELEQHIPVVRKKRIAAQKRAAERTTVETAIARVERDHSARSTPEIERERDVTERLHDELTAMFDENDRTRTMRHRLRTRTHLSEFRLEEALDAEAAFRTTLRARAAETGVVLTIPPIADPPAPTTAATHRRPPEDREGPRAGEQEAPDGTR